MKQNTLTSTTLIIKNRQSLSNLWSLGIIFVLFLLCEVFSVPRDSFQRLELLNSVTSGLFSQIQLARTIFINIFRIAIFIYFIFSRHRFIDSSYKLPLIFILVAYSSMSIFWSVDPLQSLLDLRTYVPIVLFALFLARNYTTKQIATYISISTTLALIINILFIIPVLPLFTSGVVYQEGGLLDSFVHTVFPHKNFIGLLCVLANISYIYMYSYAKRIIHKVLIAVLILFSLVSTFLSFSAAAIGINVFISALGIYLLLLNKLNKKTRFLFNLFILLLFIIIFLIGLSVDVFSLLGRDSTFTGRTEIWNIVESYIFRDFRFFIGYGFGNAVWQQESPIYQATVSALNVYSAHNGYLEVLLTLGLIGLSILMAMLIQLSYKALNSNNLFLVLSTPFIILKEITNSSLMSANILGFIFIYVYVVSINRRLASSP